jgi:hypothetical protein
MTDRQDNAPKKGLLKRTSRRCDQCLYSDARIVSLERKADIEATCLAENTHFVCHKFTSAGDRDVACRGFLEAHPFTSFNERLAHAFSGEDMDPYEDLDPREA